MIVCSFDHKHQHALIADFTQTKQLAMYPMARQSYALLTVVSKRIDSQLLQTLTACLSRKAFAACTENV